MAFYDGHHWRVVKCSDDTPSTWRQIFHKLVLEFFTWPAWWEAPTGWDQLPAVRIVNTWFKPAVVYWAAGSLPPRATFRLIIGRTPEICISLDWMFKNTSHKQLIDTPAVMHKDRCGEGNFPAFKGVSESHLSYNRLA